MVNGARHGANSWGNMAYGGPCPPPGPAHHYHFKVYALDEMLVLESGAEKEKLLEMMEGHVLSSGEIMGTYVRAEGAVEAMEEAGGEEETE
jgi:Raf kinase inhibitor-like YbhB/YbcL family protein